MAEHYNLPVSACYLPAAVTDDLQNAQDTLIAKRHLTTLLHFKNFTRHLPKVGDMVQVFVKVHEEKRGGQLSPRAVLSTDTASGAVTVPGARNRNKSDAIETFGLPSLEMTLLFMLRSLSTR